MRGELELIKGASHPFEAQAYLEGRQTPVFFGSAVNNFGVQLLLDFFIKHAPAPQPRHALPRPVSPDETPLTGFVFKIQANMDPLHRDRVAFMRVCSGCYRPGTRLLHVRSGKEVRVSDAMTFLASERGLTEEAWPGDVIGIHNHGTIAIGDSFTQGETVRFTGIPHFAPELFRRVRLKDPLRLKQLHKGLQQLSEEGATQFFRLIASNDLLLGAVGVLQFEVAAFRLAEEYGVQAQFEPVSAITARWVHCRDPRLLEEFREKHAHQLALDAAEHLVYLATSRANLQMTQERWPELSFTATREMSGMAATSDV